MIKLSIDIEHYHRCCLIIADEIKRICEKHSIKYSLDGGSMLGAVRHKGFIPWDDDMDFSMLRDDYHRFLQVCETELGDKFELINSRTESSFPFNYTKIILKGTHIEESFCRETDTKNGIFVDIFPYDKLPVDENERAKLRKKAAFYKKILWLKKGYGKCIKDESIKQKLKYFCAYALSVFFSYKNTKIKYEALLSPYESLPYDSCYLGTIDFPESFLQTLSYKNCFADYMEYEFCGRSYSGYKNYDLYLTEWYGNYMQLPPEEQRVNHGILSVDFGEY